MPQGLGETLEHSPAERAIPPPIRIDLLAPVEVVLELFVQEPHQRRIERHQVDLLVELGRARVEVRGTHVRHESVDGHDLGVQHGRAESPDPDAMPKQPLEDGLTRLLHEPLVGVRSG